MAILPSKEKLNDRSFSVGMGKRVPDKSANLAFVAAPKIETDNISLVKYFETKEGMQSFKDQYALYSANDNMVLEDSQGSATISTQNLRITDEFSLIEDENDGHQEPVPLFFTATLKRKVSGTQHFHQSIPYVYGYEERTMKHIRVNSTSTDASDLSIPRSRVEVREEGVGTLAPRTAVYKLRITEDLETPDTYILRIYHNFSQDSTFKVTYTDFEGNTVTEILESSLLFPRAIDMDEVINADLMDKVYAVQENEFGYKVYAPTELYHINDDNRKPHEFRYRVLAKLQNHYQQYNPVEMRVGFVNINTTPSHQMDGIASAFGKHMFINEDNWSEDELFPSYLTFINPHPPVKFWEDTKTMNNPQSYFESPEYWQVNLGAPQSYINDYDLIILYGVGNYNMSIFNTRLHEYLMQGGKVLVDNASNEIPQLLSLDFGGPEDLFLYNYQFDQTTSDILINNAPSQFTGDEKYSNRYYQLTDEDASDIGWVENSTPVSPQFALDVSQTSRWTSIVKHTNDALRIGYLDYFGRGKLYFSNAGILKDFAMTSGSASQKFMTNMLLCIAEENWQTTPWNYDRVYHIDQLYSDEFRNTDYFYDVDSSGNYIAKKKLLAYKDFLDYSNTSSQGSYIVEAQEFKPKPGSTDPQWAPLTRVYIPTQVPAGTEISAYALNSAGSTFNIHDLQGYSVSNIKVYNERVTFKYTLRPYTYVWREVGGEVVREKLYGAGRHMLVQQHTICRGDGLVNLGHLASLVPELPGGPEWADTNNIFFEIKVGYFNDGVFDASEHRVNLRIYDKLTGTYQHTSNGENIISYRDLYSYRYIIRHDGSRVLRRLSQDIILRASTEYYGLTANKRQFAIQQLDMAQADIQMPANLNTNENWHPRIRNMHFLKGEGQKESFNQEDYERLIRTLGFKFEKDYIIARIEEYFLEAEDSPHEDTVLALIAKLDGDGGSLSQEDKEIISEAFSLIEQDLVLEYETIEYHKQAWNPGEPLKRSRGELAKYIDTRTIGLQHGDIHINSTMLINQITREKLERVSGNIFRSINLNWLPSEDVLIEKRDGLEISGWKTLGPDGFQIDFEKGLLVFDEIMNEDVYASYTFNTIDISRKRYTNAKIFMEELKQLDSYYYDIENDHIIGFEDNEEGTGYILPIVYAVENQSLPSVRADITFNSEQTHYPLISTGRLYNTITVYPQERTSSPYVEGWGENNEFGEFVEYGDYILDRPANTIRRTKNSTIGPGETITVEYKDTPRIISPSDYEIDYERGFLKLKNRTASRIHMTYSFFEVDKLTVADYDRKTSRIELNEDIAFTDNIFVTYYYEDQYLEYKGYREGTQFIYLDLNPSQGHVCTIVSKDGDTLKYMETPTYEMLDKTVYLYMLPRRIIKDEKVLLERDVTLRHTFNLDELKLLQLAQPELIVLGSIKIRNDYTKEDIEIMDTRKLGGGLKEHLTRQEIEKVDELSLNFWDLSSLDGRQFYGNGISVIRLPKMVLDTFSSEEVEEIVQNHLAYGIMPVIEYY